MPGTGKATYPPHLQIIVLNPGIPVTVAHRLIKYGVTTLFLQEVRPIGKAV